ncbi:MAG: TonB family protein [Burkholderiales bacterium]
MSAQFAPPDPPAGVLVAALVVSILLHTFALSLNFRMPDLTRLKPPPQTLDVVLVNSKTKTTPDKPEVLAQAPLDAGGNVEEDRRAKTPLPVIKQDQRGDDVKEAKKRVQQLEVKQRELLRQVQVKKAPAIVPPPPQPEPVPTPEPPQISGLDLANRALAIARMEAQVSRQAEDYAKRPRRKFVGARAAETRYAMYVESWRQKVERIGNMNYPEQARGRIYGSLRLTVAIKSDGSVEYIQVDRPSGHGVLDRAAERIVKLASPFSAFPDNIRRDTDILVITRTWTFAHGDRLYGD